MIKKYSLFLFNIFYLIFLEIVFKVFVFKDFFERKTLFMLFFCISYSFIITIIENVFKNLGNKILTLIISFLIWLIFVCQFIYFRFYGNIFSIYSLFHGAQVLEFFGSILEVIFRNMIPLLLMTIPLVFLFVFNKKIDFERKSYKFYIIIILWSIILFFGNLGLIKKIDSKGTYSSYNLYHKVHVPKLASKSVGLLTEMRLDLKRTMFGFKEKVIINTEDKNQNEVIEAKEYNMLEINFENLIREEKNETISSMHEYFKSLNPTEKNEYTGMFEGKNLIYIVAEAFSPMAINEQLTPTLYKLYNNGFKFTNFYTPVFYVSTSDGEYITLTSLLPKEGTWSMSRSSNTYLPFVYGNLFKSEGYTANAYHDGLYTYYNRNKSLPNMGYNYKACYHGVNINCGMWPQSDIEMIDATTSDYINNEKFAVYYLTVSGHLQYTYNGNSIATKNKTYVKDLSYSEGIQAYLATQIELDKAIELLIQKLEAAGKLDNTVIALSADHYPYGLSNTQIKEYATYVNDEKFDIHKNDFLLWNNKMEKSITIDKYASSLDILPTILNLFNMQYDSRLLMGKDILSDEEGLVIFNDRSWITSKGKYNSVENKFTSFENNVSEEYIKEINEKVYNKFLMSKLILENDYYSKVIKKPS